MDGFDLAAVVSARICHDLVSPVGAVVNGVELIREIPGGEAADELTMVEQSATRAARLLTFYRMAFGRATGEGTGLSRSQLRDRLAPVLSGPRIRIDWSGLDGPALAPDAARLVALLGLCARGMIGLGGVIALELDGDADLPLLVRARGDQAQASAQQTAWLAGAPAPLPEPRQVEFVLAPGAAAAMGARLTLAVRPGEVTLTATR